MIDVTTKQMEALLLDGTIDWIQIHKAFEESFVKTYKDWAVVHAFTGLGSQDSTTNEYRQRCQSRHRLDTATIFFDKKINDYRCVCFTRHGEKYCYLSKWITSNLNICELFRMKCTTRSQVSLIDKTGGFYVMLPTTE